MNVAACLPLLLLHRLGRRFSPSPPLSCSRPPAPIPHILFARRRHCSSPSPTPPLSIAGRLVRLSLLLFLLQYTTHPSFSSPARSLRSVGRSVALEYPSDTVQLLKHSPPSSPLKTAPTTTHSSSFLFLLWWRSRRQWWRRKRRASESSEPSTRQQRTLFLLWTTLMAAGKGEAEEREERGEGLLGRKPISRSFARSLARPSSAEFNL